MSKRVCAPQKCDPALPTPPEHQFCGGRLEKPQGSLNTPNWPEENYPPGISCSWHIVAPPDQVWGLLGGSGWGVQRGFWEGLGRHWGRLGVSGDSGEVGRELGDGRGSQEGFAGVRGSLGGEEGFGEGDQKSFGGGLKGMLGMVEERPGWCREAQENLGRGLKGLEGPGGV